MYIYIYICRKGSCYTWTEFSTDNGEFDQRSRDWIYVHFKHFLAFQLPSPRHGDCFRLGSLPSVDSLQNAKVCLGKLESILPSINFRLSFLRIHWKETYKSIYPMSIPPKLSAGTSFNKMEKLDHQLFEIWVSCGFFNKRDMKNDAPAN